MQKLTLGWLWTGFGFSFGIFQEYYTTHAPFAGSANIAVIGTTTMVSITSEATERGMLPVALGTEG